MTSPPPPEWKNQDISPRMLWALNRFRMESENMKTKRYGGKSRQHWAVFMFLIRVFGVLLKLTGLYARGKANAANLALNQVDLYFPDLPLAFDGFNLLHLSDLHLDGELELEPRVLELLRGKPVDLCVLTGDYRTELHGPIKRVMSGLEQLVDGIQSKEGFVGILGNHDDCHMVGPMEAIGIRMLLNEDMILTRGADRLRLIGTDDVHYYYTDQALHALEKACLDFTIGLIHSPELYRSAQELGVDLYLCGHVHAGQIALPGGRPLITHVSRGRRFYAGAWRYKTMQGYSHAGVGASGLPVRFNTRGEVALLRLHRGLPPQNA